jgi:hypothetical protein
MTYNSLTGGKSTPGSIISWVSYTKLDVFTVVDEAQSLLYQSLRCREMRSEWTFGIDVGNSEIALPTGFLDPIGRLYDLTHSTWFSHRIETDILTRRSYDTSLSGSYATDPFTTTSGSSLVNVALANHDINQGSTVFNAGANAVGGLTLNGSFPVVAVVDTNNFTIDAGTAASSAATGGGASVTYTANNLTQSSPTIWTIWDEKVKFDTAFAEQTTFKQLYYKAPALLSLTNQSNWVTNRYPMLLRVACLAAAAMFMKDDGETQKNIQALNALIASTAAENDMGYRGMEFGTDTPYGGDYS